MLLYYLRHYQTEDTARDPSVRFQYADLMTLLLYNVNYLANLVHANNCVERGFVFHFLVRFTLSLSLAIPIAPMSVDYSHIRLIF